MKSTLLPLLASLGLLLFTSCQKEELATVAAPDIDPRIMEQLGKEALIDEAMKELSLIRASGDLPLEEKRKTINKRDLTFEFIGPRLPEATEGGKHDNGNEKFYRWGKPCFPNVYYLNGEPVYFCYSDYSQQWCYYWTKTGKKAKCHGHF